MTSSCKQVELQLLNDGQLQPEMVAARMQAAASACDCSSLLGAAATKIGCRDGESTVDRGLRETVTYRNALGFFPDLGIETVRAPPLRATETTVT